MSTNLNGPIHSAAPLDIVIRNTCANVAIILTRVHNMQVELNELKAEQAKLRSAILLFLSDPQAVQDAAAVLQDFHFHKGQPSK